ncbi:hypothetical protein BYT27DRAFT_7253085 [Phlegmacium glaucopus]|nr:hypothetical protein BYT27DRAFT_7253085 [Phlegmacium glaucopus]
MFCLKLVSGNTFLPDRKSDYDYNTGNRLLRSSRTSSVISVTVFDIDTRILYKASVRDAVGHCNRHKVMKLTGENFFFIGTCLEGFLYGLYSGIFAMYLQGTSNKGIDTDKRKNILFYALCVLYVLSGVTVMADIAIFIYALQGNPTAFLHLNFIQGTAFGCCDFIAQSMLIYRCWIVWGRNIRVVILPSILAFVYLVMWLVSNSSGYILSGRVILEPEWGYWMALAGIVMSMTVNALVTCLILFKIFKVYHEIRSASDDQSLGATGESKIRTVIFIVIESGMALFSIQLARLVVSPFTTTDAASGLNAFGIIIYIHQMLNGIIPTIILVRVSMGLSFHDKEPVIESSIGSLHFAANNPNSISETETEDVGIVNRDNDIGVRQSDDIEMVAETGDVGIVDRDHDIGVQQSDDIEMVDR